MLISSYSSMLNIYYTCNINRWVAVMEKKYSVTTSQWDAILHDLTNTKWRSSIQVFHRALVYKVALGVNFIYCDQNTILMNACISYLSFCVSPCTSKWLDQSWFQCVYGKLGWRCMFIMFRNHKPFFALYRRFALKLCPNGR